MHHCCMFLVGSALLVASAAAEFTTYTSVQNATKNCTGTPFAPTKEALDQCLDRTMKYVDRTCAPSNATCVDVEWFSGLSCTASALHSTYTYECNTCYADFGIPFFFYIRDCHDDNTRALHYGCNSQCEDCSGVMSAPLKGCGFVAWELMMLRPLRLRPCPSLMLEKSFASANCTGEFFPWTTATNTCINQDTASYFNTCA